MSPFFYKLSVCGYKPLSQVEIDLEENNWLKKLKRKNAGFSDRMVHCFYACCSYTRSTHELDTRSSYDTF
jgi:hypothetical protein